MSYHVTILKTRHGRPESVGFSELCNAANQLPDVEVSTAGDRLTILRSGDELFSLWWQNGEAWTTNPDETTLALMIDIADRVGGRVRGDEFETYRAANDTYFHPDDQQLFDRARHEVDTLIRDTRRRSLVLHSSIFVTFLALALLVHSCSGG